MEHVEPLWRTVGAGVVYAIAYLAAVGAFAWMARRRGLATEGIRLLAGAALVGGLIGANLAQLLIAGAIGKTILGGFAGGYLAVVLMKRHLGIRRRRSLPRTGRPSAKPSDASAASSAAAATARSPTSPGPFKTTARCAIRRNSICRSPR